MGKLIVTNTSVLLHDMTIARGQIVETENGIISAIRPYQEGEEITLSGNKETELLDGSRKLLMPGLPGMMRHCRMLSAIPPIRMWRRQMRCMTRTMEKGT